MATPIPPNGLKYLQSKPLTPTCPTKIISIASPRNDVVQSIFAKFLFIRFLITLAKLLIKIQPYKYYSTFLPKSIGECRFAQGMMG